MRSKKISECLKLNKQDDEFIKFAKIGGYIGIALGIWRFLEYFSKGDIHGGFALALGIHALVTGILIFLTIKYFEL